MTALASTITIVKDKNVVSTSKHLVNLFKEAKSAYLDKKADLKAAREDGPDRELTPKISDHLAHSRHASRETSKHRKHSSASPHRQRKLPIERSYTDGFYVNDDGRVEISTANGYNADTETNELRRRHSTSDLAAPLGRTSPTGDLPTEALYIDDDADDELPPPLPPRPRTEHDELRTKMTTLQRMIEEANCMEHTARAIIKSLEKNPDAMAAVALTLAEISNLLRKMAPGALLSLRTAFPAVVALLASPEFLIAAGVGVGITIVAFGSYKIIKRIQAKRAGTTGVETPTDELEEATVDLERVAAWRRGISESEAESVGTSIEEEFMTPGASRQLREEGAVPLPEVLRRSNTMESVKVVKKEKESSGLKMLFRR